MTHGSLKIKELFKIFADPEDSKLRLVFRVEGQDYLKNKNFQVKNIKDLIDKICEEASKIGLSVVSDWFPVWIIKINIIFLFRKFPKISAILHFGANKTKIVKLFHIFHNFANIIFIPVLHSNFHSFLIIGAHEVTVSWWPSVIQ